MTLFDVECAQGVSRGWLPKYAARGCLSVKVLTCTKRTAVRGIFSKMSI